MGYLSVWKILDEMIADFRQKGATFPDKVMNDLKSAKTLLNAPAASQDISRIDAYLANVEAYLISEGEKSFGKEYADEWLNRLDEASRKPSSQEEEQEERFVIGLPREGRWIRVKPSADLPIEKLQALIKESDLSYNSQEDGYLLIYGSDKQVKDFIKKMTTKHEPKLEK
ncbi:MAG TPA: DUF2096 family protein [Candidatus Acidoferrum sp.]|jgi:hypothetical protein|nr:DUF2096 family protein [Candidatus Acidoferrum sp.]